MAPLVNACFADTRPFTPMGKTTTPSIAVLMPVYNPPERWLRRAIDSVRAQSYPNWHLCIADDASPAPHVARVLAEATASDQRIRVVHRPRNGHISEASNSALALADGEFVALLDHDDELHPDALLHMAEAIHRHPSAGVLYSDEDKIDEQGRRYEPYFKPRFDPDLLLGQNCVFRRSRTWSRPGAAPWPTTSRARASWPRFRRSLAATCPYVAPCRRPRRR